MKKKNDITTKGVNSYKCKLTHIAVVVNGNQRSGLMLFQAVREEKRQRWQCACIPMEKDGMEGGPPLH